MAVVIDIHRPRACIPAFLRAPDEADNEETA
jgi:hypothetical protein